MGGKSERPYPLEEANDGEDGEGEKKIGRASNLLAVTSVNISSSETSHSATSLSQAPSPTSRGPQPM